MGRKDIRHDSALTKVRAKEKARETAKEKEREEDIKGNVGYAASGAIQHENAHTRANHSAKERVM